MENNSLLPPAVQEQVDRFYRDYPPKEAKLLVERYLKLVLGEDYRSANIGRTEAHMTESTRPRPRARGSTFKEAKSKKSSTSTSRSSRTAKNQFSQTT